MGAWRMRRPKISINFLPNAGYEPAACLRATLAAARKSDFPREAIMFEFTENKLVRDTVHLVILLIVCSSNSNPAIIP